MEKEVYIEKIAKEYGISKEAIYGEVNKLVYSKTSDKKVLERAPIKNYIKKEETEKIEEDVIKREKMVIYILVNYPEEVYHKIKDIITIDTIKAPINKKIIEKIYEQYEKNNMGNILDCFEEEEVVNYLSGIMADDFGVADINKCIEDLLNTYNKEKLISIRKNIIKKLENASSMPEEEVKNLERELNDVILKLAKVK